MSSGSRANLLAAVCCASLLEACASTQLQSVEGTPPVARPQIKIGDSWSYRRMDYWKNRETSAYELRVTFANDKSILAVVTEAGGRDSDASYTAEWNSIVSAFDQAVISPDTGMLRFPLRMGATHRTSFQLDSTRRDGEIGSRMIEGVSTSKFEYTVKVVGWEEVVVPAGRFKALRVEAEGSMLRQQGIVWAGSGAQVTGFARTVIWYVPEMKRWVKYLYEDFLRSSASSVPNLLTANDRHGEELLEFKLQ